MEFYPNQLFRLIQLGDEKRVLVSNTMWLCLCCYTCSVRCPNDIDIAKVMDSLRMIALAQGYSSPFPQALAFHQVFLNCVRRYGKVNEVELMLRYNLRLRKPFQRLLLGLTMLSKGRLEILPRRIKGRKELHQIFENKGG
jgi:heterodisulfide reductase subunit C